MAQPLFFQPDPEIEDSDLLGYGDLLFDDGSSQYVSGEPDIAQSYPAPDLAPMPDSYTPQPMTEFGESYGDAQGPGSGMQPVPIQGHEDYMVHPATAEITRAPGRTQLLDPGTGAVLGESGEVGDGSEQLQSTGAPQVAKLSEPKPIPGSPHYSVIPATSEIVPSNGGFGANGLQLAQREGALPQDVAQRQAAERQDMNSSAVAQLMISRNQEEQIYRQAALQRKGQLDAEQQALKDQQAEQQAKVQRWRQEQQQTADMDIKTDLVSAEGGVGALFSIIGAALLGAVGSDAGLRMVDSTIDQNVRKQLSRRDSKLHLLADQVGSAEQAIATGKAELYKIAAEKAEVSQKLVAADAFGAQTPELVSQLRQKQVQYEQEKESISLGKTLEKAPAGPPQLSPAQLAKQVQGYGEAAATLQQGQQDLLRAASAVGLEGWDPKTGHFKNRDQITGLPGIGKWDTFYSDLGKLPVVGALPQAIDNAITSQQGQDVRTALQALVEAKAAQRSPGRAPSEGDRQAARNELGFNTEKGVLDAIEKMMGQQETQKAQIVARFGPQAAAAYEQRLQEQGGQTPQPTGGAVDSGQKLEPGQARQQLEQYRSRPAEQGPTSSRVGGEATDLTNSIRAYAEHEGLNPEAVAAVIQHESGGSSSAVNSATGKHAGLIQFSKETWPGVARSAGRPDISWDEMRKMTPEEQLPFVMAYFRDRGLTEHDTPGDYAMAAFMPAFRDHSDDFVLGDPHSDMLLGGLRSSKIWQQNPGLRDENGLITVGSVKRSVGG